MAIDVSPREKLLPVESLVTSLLQLLQENGPFLEQFTQCQSSALKLVAVVQRSVVRFFMSVHQTFSQSDELDELVLQSILLSVFILPVSHNWTDFHRLL